MLFTFVLVLQAIVGLFLVGVILAQRSEGGGLTGGGSPAGLMSARGAADFLTRSTAILATVFVALTILLAVMAATRHSTSIDTSLKRTAPLNSPAGSAPQPTGGAFSGSAANAAAGAGGNIAFPGALAPGENQAAPASNSAVPVR